MNTMQNQAEQILERLPLYLKVKLILKSCGPGVVTGAADDDPSGIATYTVAGARFGHSFLWVALVTWPMMASVQMACAHLAMMSGEGLAAALAKKFPRYVMIAVCVSLFLANTLNVGADLSAMADCAELLTGLSSHFFVVFFGVVIAYATVRMRYTQIASILKWLALSLFAYVISALIEKPDWMEVARATFVPHVPHGNEAWQTLVAILGTTISPYLFFWQASQEVEEKKAAGANSLFKRKGATAQQQLERKLDVRVGTLFSNVVMFFIILSASLTLHRGGKTEIETSRQAAEALVPLAGHFSSLLYTLGLLGVGVLAIPTLTGSAAYACAETFRWRQGLDAKWIKARAFYSVILVSGIFGVLFDLFKFNPIKALFYSAVLNGLLAPFLLVGILTVIRDRKIMNGHPAPISRQVVLFITMLFMFAAAVCMFVF
ncbi:MAG: Nramp family divalent metal transporter [Bdellovibrionales bacterium]